MSRVEEYRDTILRGKPLRTIFWLAYPLIVANLVNVSYNLIDALWLGRLGAPAFGGVIVSIYILSLVYSFGMGFASACIALISQLVGSGAKERAEEVAGEVVVFMEFVALVLSVVGFLTASSMLDMLGVPRDVYSLALAYMRTLFVGVPIAFGYFVYVFVSNAIGDTRTPTKLSIASTILNAVLDPMLIFGIPPFPRLGVVGAAIATIMSRGLVSFVGMYLLITGYRGFRIRLRWRIEAEVLQKILSVGLPISFQSFVNSIAFVVMMRIVSQFGTSALAAYGVADRVIEICGAVVRALSQSIAVIVGQCIGAELFDRAKRVAIDGSLVVFLILLMVSISISLASPEIVVIFVNDPSVVRIGTDLMSVFTLSIPFFALHFISMGIGRGSGSTRIPALISIVRLWGLRVPLSILLPMVGLGVRGVWIAMTLSNIVAGLASWFWIISGRWLKKIV